MLCFFVKQKTAYEMRISDWSSDVCSSDLHRHPGEDDGAGTGRPVVPLPDHGGGIEVGGANLHQGCEANVLLRGLRENRTVPGDESQGYCINEITTRAEERRVGKERVRTCRSRGSPQTKKKKKIKMK